MQNLQLLSLHEKYNALQKKFGDPDLAPIYGTGCVVKPKLMLIFMNPTGKNITSGKNWQGLRAPWLGTKNIWKLIYAIGSIGKNAFESTQTMKPDAWDKNFSETLYKELAKNKFFITNLAKCTQKDARALNNSVFRAYRSALLEEILTLKPRHIVSFGNQVSSVLLEENIKVSAFQNCTPVALCVKGAGYPVYPVHYPVGQGMRNLKISIKTIKKIVSL